MLMKGNNEAKMTGSGSHISSKENMKTSRQQLGKEANETQFDEKSPINIQNEDQKMPEDFTFNKSLDRAKKSTSQINLAKLKNMKHTQNVPKMARSPQVNPAGNSETNISALKTTQQLNYSFNQSDLKH